jgi:Tol biopolymer transport system component
MGIARAGSSRFPVGGWVGGVMRRVMAVFVVAVAGFAVVPQVAVGAFIERVSVAGDGSQANNDNYSLAISADGRYVAFYSAASSLVPGDTNGALDVFVRDRRAGTTQRVSVATDGSQGNGFSYDPAISADGRYVAFDSYASSLVPGDTNGDSDVFVRDRRLGTTQRVSVATNGSQGNGDSASPAISADGRYVAFSSDASNLVPGDTNGALDVFVRDRRSGTTQRVSVATDGSQANGGSPAISADGRYVAFTSVASNLVPGDTNGFEDVFVRDLKSGTTRRVSVATDGSQGNNDSSVRPAISADGRYVAFESYASNLVPGDTNGLEFVRDLRLDTTRQVDVAADGGQPNGLSFFPAISADGRYVAFESYASNLVPGDTNHSADVFVRDLKLSPPPPSNKFTVSRIKTETDGTITFSVKVPGPGSVDVLETAWDDNLASAAVLLKPAPHRFVFARAHVPAARQGTLKVTVTPNQHGRLLVADPRYRVVLRLWVSYTPDGGRYRTIGYLGLHLPGTCAKHNTVTALKWRTVVRCN